LRQAEVLNKLSDIRVGESHISVTTLPDLAE